MKSHTLVAWAVGLTALVGCKAADLPRESFADHVDAGSPGATDAVDGDQTGDQIGKDGGATDAGVVASVAQAGRIAAGGDTTCVIDAKKRLWCWGQGAFGVPGQGNQNDVPTPVQISQLDDVVYVGLTAYHACAVRGDGTLYCWGDNEEGQIEPGGKSIIAAPTQVPGIDDAVAVAACSYHTCVLHKDGTVSCWGSNHSGQIGDGTSADTPQKRAQSKLTGKAVALECGYDFTCALRADGTVWCWGTNGSGQLGSGSKLDSPLPLQVLGVSGAVSLMVGQEFACAVLGDGGVMCWGDNRSGELGRSTKPAPDGAGLESVKPVPVTGAKAVIAGSSGVTHSCAITSESKVLCWGRNTYGELGDGSGIATFTARLAAINGAVAVAVGNRHSCAVTDSGNVWCWGSNALGAVGTGTIPNFGGLHAVKGLATAVFVAAGDDHSCALAGGKPWCWGRNRHFQVSPDDDRTIIAEPVQVGWDSMAKVVVGGESSCGISAQGVMACWGDNVWDPKNGEFVVGTEKMRTVTGIGGVSDAALTSGHRCALDKLGKVYCWGQNYSHQLGTGTDTDSATPLPVQATIAFAAIVAGGGGTCAIAKDASLWCWGDGSEGALGHDAGDGPAPVPGLKVTHVAIGTEHMCALDQQAAVWCWGNNSTHQLGAGGGLHQAKPVKVGIVGAVTAIGTGEVNSCAVAGGELLCWGGNDNQQTLGMYLDGADNTVTKPTKVGLTGATAVALGSSHTCVLAKDTGVTCFGSNWSGQLGVTTAGAMELKPVKLTIKW